MIAELSHGAEDLNQELQWASSFGVPVVMAVKKGRYPPKFVKPIAKGIVVYSNSKELIKGLQEYID